MRPCVASLPVDGSGHGWGLKFCVIAVLLLCVSMLSASFTQVGAEARTQHAALRRRADGGKTRRKEASSVRRMPSTSMYRGVAYLGSASSTCVCPFALSHARHGQQHVVIVLGYMT